MFALSSACHPVRQKRAGHIISARFPTSETPLSIEFHFQARQTISPTLTLTLTLTLSSPLHNKRTVSPVMSSDNSPPRSDWRRTARRGKPFCALMCMHYRRRDSANSLTLLLIHLHAIDQRPRTCAAEDANEPASQVIARAGERVELACHLFGRPLEWRPDLPARWAVRAGSDPPDAADNGELEPNEADLVSLVFWFKGDNPAPIYTLDARQVALNLSEEEENIDGEANKTYWPIESGSSKQQTAKLVPSKSTQVNSNKFRATRPINESGQQQLLITSANKRLLAAAKHYPGKLASERLQLDASWSQFPLVRLQIESATASDTADYKCRVDFRRSRTISQLVSLLVKGRSTEVALFALLCNIMRCSFLRK